MSDVDQFVRRTQDDYAQGFAALLPQGNAWPRDPDSALMRFVSGQAGVWGTTVDPRAADLIQIESDPRLTIEMLPDWEMAFGLPDPCNAENQTIETRRAALLTRMTTLGAQSIAFFYGVAAALGYEIDIYEYQPVQCGISRCGETRPNATLRYDPFRCGVHHVGVDHLCDIELSAGDDWIWRIGPPEIRYFWRVTVLGTRLTWFRCGTGQVGKDHFCEIGHASDLECLFTRWKPGHTEVTFDYSQAVSTNG